MAENKNDQYYVSVAEPIEIKRNVLEASKGLIQVLQGYEVIKETRDEKLAIIDEVKSLLAELNVLGTKLKSQMPKVKDHVPQHLMHLINPQAEEKSEQDDASKPVHKTTRKLSEMDKLERELKDIEHQLGKLV